MIYRFVAAHCIVGHYWGGMSVRRKWCHSLNIGWSSLLLVILVVSEDEHRVTLQVYKAGRGGGGGNKLSLV